MVVRRPAQEQAMGLAGSVSQDAPDRRVCHRRPRRKDLPPAVERIPLALRHALAFTDFWEATRRWCQRVSTSPAARAAARPAMSASTTRPPAKRGSCGRRSFSKSEVMHESCLRLFLHHYNTNMARRTREATTQLRPLNCAPHDYSSYKGNNTLDKQDISGIIESWKRTYCSKDSARSDHLLREPRPLP
jgi:hypothetical protein